jgi:esterase/lipase
MSKRTRVALGTVAALVLVILLGPRPRVEEPGALPAVPPLRELPSWLAAQEQSAGVTDRDVAKHVVFANPSAPARTTWSVIYLHGFSATRQETAPVSEEVARLLGANLYETRLTGHGLPGDSLGRVTARDWLTDAALSLAIGRALGDSILVIGTSTGGTLAVWLATASREVRSGVARLVLISPNFGPVDRAAGALTLPWATVLLPPLIPYREWTARNEEQRRYWTVRYPSTALFPMQAMVEAVRERPLDTFVTPTLVFYNRRDAVVDAARTDAWLERVARTGKAPVERVMIVPNAAEDGHVIAGRIVAPGQTATFVSRIVTFVRRGLP